MIASATSRRIVLLGMLLSVACLAYFYMLDRVVFSSEYFVRIFEILLTVYDARTAWLSVAVCFLAAAWNRPAQILRLVDWLGRNPRGVSAACIIAFALGAATVYHDYPLSMDEYAAVFQSKIFAAGRLYAQLPSSVINWLIVPGFNGTFLMASRETGRAIEGYWPGFALLLAPFELFGAPWLCNAALAGLAVYLIHRITAEVTGDQRAAGWAVLFAVCSGAFIAYAISYYSMQAHLTANLLFVWILLRPTPSRAFVAGLVGSLALVLHNPLPHALFAAPWLIAMAIQRNQRRFLLPLILGYLPGVGVLLAWLWLRTQIIPVAHSVSAVVGIGGGVFVPPDELLLQIRAASIAKLWVWSVPCLFLFAVLGSGRRWDNPAVRRLAASAMLTFVAYLFVRLDQGHGWGYRYFHPAWGVIPILAACAMTRTSESKDRLIPFAGAAAVLSLLIIVPFQMSQIEGFISRHLAQNASPRRPGNNVYFIPPGGGSYMSDMIQIDPLLRDQDLLLASRGGKLDAELVRQNWPDAVIVNHGYWAQQWYLGPIDQRRSTGDRRAAKHFELAFTASPSP